MSMNNTFPAEFELIAVPINRNEGMKLIGVSEGDYVAVSLRLKQKHARAPYAGKVVQIRCEPFERNWTTDQTLFAKVPVDYRGALFYCPIMYARKVPRFWLWRWLTAWRFLLS